MGLKRFRIQCKLCGAFIGKTSTLALSNHLIFMHKLSDFVDEKGNCLFCNSSIPNHYTKWSFNWTEHFSNKHTFRDFFDIVPNEHLEFLEFICEHCYRGKKGVYVSCWLDRKSYDTGYVKPVCQWCGRPMRLKRKVDRVRY